MSKQPHYLDEAFEDICKELTDLFVKKHLDYGKENILEIGELGVAYRTAEKISRLRHLLQSGASPSNESLEDSWKDIAVYSIIALLYRRGLFQKLTLRNSKKSGLK